MISERSMAMKHTGFGTLGAAALISAMCSFAAFAATPITTVNFNYTIDGENSISDGYNEPSIELNSNVGYDVSDCTVSSSDTSLISGKTAVTYTLTLSADSGYYFPDANSINVTGSNITEITKKTVSRSDNSALTVKFKAYPYIRLAAPSYVTDFNSIKGDKSRSETKGRESTLNINKNGASKIEYVISYVDQDGEYKSKNGSVTGSSISVGTYNKRYTGSGSDKQSCYIRGIAIRAAGVQGSNDHVAPSHWVYISGGSTSIDTDEYYTDYVTWDDFLSNNGGSGSSSSSASSNVSIFGWQSVGDKWYYYNNGSKVTGWVFDGSNWYYCSSSDGAMAAGWIQDATGNWFLLNQSHDGTYGCMKSGWQLVDGRWYYLNTNHDGSFGAMKTGWLNLNGVYYYLNPVSGGPKGAMVTGTQYIDGRTYYFSGNGVLIR